jgi:Peptidase propeptide and YPEB domain
MLKQSCTVAALVLAMTGSQAALAHDHPGADWISKDVAIAKVKALGYDAVRLEADDGHWDGEATKNGQFFDIHVDPHTGALIGKELER